MNRFLMPLALVLATAPAAASATAVADALSTFMIDIVSGTSTGDDSKTFVSEGIEYFSFAEDIGFAFGGNAQDALPDGPSTPAPVEAAIGSGAIGGGGIESHADASLPFGAAIGFGSVGADVIFTNGSSMMDMIVEIEVMVDLSVAASSDDPVFEFSDVFAGAFIGTFDPITSDPIEDFLDIEIEAASDGTPSDSFMQVLPISLTIAPGESLGFGAAIYSDAFAIAAVPLPATALMLLAGVGGLFGMRRFL